MWYSVFLPREGHVFFLPIPNIPYINAEGVCVYMYCTVSEQYCQTRFEYSGKAKAYSYSAPVQNIGYRLLVDVQGVALLCFLLSRLIFLSLKQLQIPSS